MSGLGVSHYLAPPGYPLVRFLDEAVAAGATAVGVTERALAECALPTLRRLLRDRHLAVTSVNSAGFFLFGHPERAREQRAVNDELLDAAAELEAKVLVVIGGGLGDAGPHRAVTLADTRRIVEDGLPTLIEAGRSRGVRLGLEPMHPLRIFNISTLNTLAQALALCERLPGLDIVLDVFHCWWDPELEPVLARAVDRIALVQLCDVTHEPREPALPRRCPLGAGVVDLRSLTDLLDRLGYRGPFEFELFAADLGRGAVPDAMSAAVSGFDALRRKGTG